MAGNLDLFLEIQGVEGESKKKGHENQMDINSWSFMAHNPVSGAGAGTSGKVALSDIQVTKPVDKASPRLFLGCCGATRYPKATIYGQRMTNDQAGAKVFYKVELTDVVVSMVRNDYVDPEGEDAPGNIVETLTLNPTTMKVSYGVQSAKDGAVGAMTPLGWNLETNAAA